VRGLDRRAVVCALAILAALGGASGGAVAQATETPTENGTVQHERPEAAGESGDLQALQRWLDGRLSGQLESSTVALSEGEYERARAMLGDDYDERLDQYVDVAGETGEGEDAGETYRDVRESQRDLATQAERFEQANERYDRARENGNETAARQAAREMNRVGDRIGRSGANTTRGYATLENQTGVDTDSERAVVTNLTADVRERQEAVRQATFVETELAVLEATRTISFTDPLELTGRLTAENGSAVANRDVIITVADRPRATTTDGEGRFTVTYRPRTLRTDATSVAVAYVPRNESAYLGSNASGPVDVQQVEPTLTVREHTEQTSFGEPAGAIVAVTVDGQPVDGIPVVADVAGQRVGRATTNDEGAVRVDGPLPATVPAGDQELRVAVPLRDRAIAAADEQVPTTVDETGTALNVTGERRGSEATVSGRLITDDGRPVDGQQVQLSRNGTVVTTVETGPNGSYAVTVPLAPESAAPSGRVQVAASFDGAETNLDAARATTTFDVDQAGGSSTLRQEWLPGDVSLSVLVGVGVTGVGLVLLGVWLVRRRRSNPGEESDDAPAVSQSATETTDESPDGPPAIERAETFLERGAAGAAVRAAYAAVRELHAADGAPRTHAELVATTESLGEDEQRAFERVTSAYEREAFARGSVDERGARDALDAAGELVERRQS
jgi:hypothetical protein